MEVFPDCCVCPRVGYLLLVCVFVLKAAANCPNPTGGETTVLTVESLLLNEFPQGVQVTLECANGYVRESGSDVMTCSEGTWSEPDLTCKKKDCGPPDPQPHMSFDVSAGTLFGDKIKAVCDKGYQIRGLSYKTCYSSGWRGNPRCEIVTCDKPAEVMNGRSSWDSADEPQYGATVVYSCTEGFSLVGPAAVRCSESGEYDSQPPTCEGVTTTETTTTTTETHSTPAQEASASPALATPTAHREETTSTPPVSPSVPGVTTDDVTTNKMVKNSTSAASIQGGRDVAAEAAPTSATSKTPSSIQEQNDAVDMKTIGHICIAATVILATALVAVILYRLKKRGSYDTREDLKSELSQFRRLSA